MRTLALSLVFASLTATACPDLAGTYANCRTTTGNSKSSHDMVITQSVTNGVTTYTMKSTDDETNETTEDVVVADGVAHTQTEESEMGQMTLTAIAKCMGNKVVYDANMAISGQSVATINMQLSKSGKTLTNKISGQIFGQSTEDTLICE